MVSKISFILFIKFTLIKNILSQVLPAGNYGYQSMQISNLPLNNVPVANFARNNIPANDVSMTNGMPLMNGMPIGNGLPFSNAVLEKNTILLNNGLPFAGKPINPGVNYGMTVRNSIPIASGMPITTNMPDDRRFQIINNMPLNNKVIYPNSPPMDEILVTNGVPFSSSAMGSGMSINNRFVPVNFEPLVSNTMPSNNRLPMSGISMSNGLPFVNGLSANNILSSGMLINDGFESKNRRLLGRILQVPVSDNPSQFSNFANMPVVRRSISNTNTPAELDFYSNMATNANLFGGSGLAIPGNVKMNMPASNVLQLGELGMLPMFNGLPVAGITETVTVLNPKVCKYFN